MMSLRVALGDDGLERVAEYCLLAVWNCVGEVVAAHRVIVDPVNHFTASSPSSWFPIPQSLALLADTCRGQQMTRAVM